MDKLATVLAAVAALSSTGEAQFDGPGGFGTSTKCQAFRCQDGGTPVPKRPLVLKSTACSGGGMTMMNMGAMGGGNDELAACCDQKNACFSICGASKSKCESNFKSCAASTCASMHVGDEEGKKKCDQNANLQSMMANINGCSQYDAAQAAACDCVADEDKAVRRRKQSLTDFYKKHNKGKLEEVEGLHKKHGKTTSAKFAKLMVKLVQKYPAAIRRVKTKEQEMMDKIMKDGKFNADALPKDTKSPKPVDADDSETDSVDVEVDADADEVVHDEM